MTRKITSLVTTIGLVAAIAAGQNAPPSKPAPARAAAPKATSEVDAVVDMLKGGLSETFIIKKLVKDNKPVNLTTADILKLKQAGGSENLMTVMMDPSAVPAVAPAAAPAPPAAPEAPATPAPIQATAAVAFSPTAPVATGNAQKKRVIVDPFDYAAVMTSVTAVFGNQQNIGKGIENMLITRLGKSGKLIVVDRAKVKQVMDEQDFNTGNRTKQGSGARVGRISGADAILTGAVVIFGRDDKKKGGALHAVEGYCRLCGALGAGKKDDKAVVAIDYQLIDAETTEVIATGEARGESKRSGFSVGAAMADYWKGSGGGGQVDMGSSNFAETIIGEATQDCVNKLAEFLDGQAVDMKKTVPDVEATVVDVRGATVGIAAGNNNGVTSGEVFEIFHVDHEIIDPTTKEVLDRAVTKVGELTIIEVRDKVAFGGYSGQPVQVGGGFVARNKKVAQPQSSSQ